MHQFKKRYGQHFLRNIAVVNKIADSVGSDSVVEIGPGDGALTYALLCYGKLVKAIEIDLECIVALQSRFAEYISDGRLEIIHADVLNYQFSYANVVGNLPYNIGTKIIEKFMYKTIPSGVFMLQKEVAQRIIGTKGNYGRLSICVQARYDVSKIVSVSRNSFFPKPRVESEVILLTEHNRLNAVNLERLNYITKSMFQFPRKKIAHLKKTHPDIVYLLDKLNVDLNLRAEDVPLNVFYIMAELLDDYAILV